jgi:cell division protein ZapA
MSEVTVTIAGRAYRMACDPGQEDYLTKLGVAFDQKIDQMRASFGEIGDMRLIVMAAIVTADELSESGRRIAELEKEVARLQNEDERSDAQRDQSQREAVQAINTLAERIENLAEDLSAHGRD